MSILDKYGIKEVSDITFYKIEPDGSRGAPVLFLDTLKISNIEQTAEVSEARGGRGNAKIIVWDHSKEINVTVEDALISPKSLSIVYNGGQLIEDNNDKITKIVMTTAKGTGKLKDYFWADIFDENGRGKVRKKIYVKGSSDEENSATLDEAGITIIGLNRQDETEIPFTGADGIFQASDWTEAQLDKYEKIFITYEMPASSKKITITPDSFPGMYYIVGETYARANTDGKDEFFQFIIPKAKVSPENSLTMEADGGPSTFNMNLTALKAEDGIMMKLVQYKLTLENKYLYGIPSDAGNIGLWDGTAVTYYDGLVLPNIEGVYTEEVAEQYPYVFIHGDPENFLTKSIHMHFLETDWEFDSSGSTYCYYGDPGSNYTYYSTYYSDVIWSRVSESQLTATGKFNIGDDLEQARPRWSNYTMYNYGGGAVCLESSDPIPVGEIVDTIDGVPIYEDLRVNL